MCGPHGMNRPRTFLEYKPKPFHAIKHYQSSVQWQCFVVSPNIWNQTDKKKSLGDLQEDTHSFFNKKKTILFKLMNSPT